VTPCDEGVAKTHCDILDVTPHSSEHIRNMVSAKQLHDEVAAALAIAWPSKGTGKRLHRIGWNLRRRSNQAWFRHFASAQGRWRLPWPKKDCRPGLRFLPMHRTCCR